MLGLSVVLEPGCAREHPVHCLAFYSFIAYFTVKPGTANLSWADILADLKIPWVAGHSKTPDQLRQSEGSFKVKLSNKTVRRPHFPHLPALFSLFFSKFKLAGLSENPIFSNFRLCSWSDLRISMSAHLQFRLFAFWLFAPDFNGTYIMKSNSSWDILMLT